MIERSQRDGILTLRLAHGKASALDLELIEATALALAEARDARAVILTGTGSIFSAGVDLYRLVDGGAEYTEQFVPALSRMLLDLFSFPKPLVVAVNGHAIAGGCIMTLAGDYRLMAGGNGRIGIPELLVGVPFPPMKERFTRKARLRSRLPQFRRPLAGPRPEGPRDGSSAIAWTGMLAICAVVSVPYRDSR